MFLESPITNIFEYSYVPRGDYLDLTLLTLEHSTTPAQTFEQRPPPRILGPNATQGNMAGSSSPPRVSRYPKVNELRSSPFSYSNVDLLSPDRNSEKSHKEALAAAKYEHERIRAKALVPAQSFARTLLKY